MSCTATKRGKSLVQAQLLKHYYTQKLVAAVHMKRSWAKSNDDLIALMHVTYTGEDALPLQQDTEM